MEMTGARRIEEGSFERALREKRAQGRFPVIGDIKCRSPKEGDLMRGRNPVEIALTLARAGAPALSVVTEGAQFGGSLALLTQVAEGTGLPILRKDFIKSQRDLEETKERGASAVLLICALLEEARLRRLYAGAMDLGLEVLLEAHNREELSLAQSMGAPLIGVNNREIKTLERDSGTVETTEKLLQNRPGQGVYISESGLFDREDVRKAARAGADAALVGTALLQAEDPGALYQALSFDLAAQG